MSSYFVMMSRKHDTLNVECETGAAVDRAVAVRFMAACLVWAVVFVATSWTLRADGAPTGGMAWALAAVCVALGLVALGAYRQFLADSDELARRIQLEGVSFGFGVGLLFSLTYGLFNMAGAPETGMAQVGTVLIVGYVAGVLRATVQYS